MIIKKDTPMLLFRFRDYKNTDFVYEHSEVLKKNKYVWILKVGKRTSIDNINNIIKEGGYMILRSPKNQGGRTFLATITEVSEQAPFEEIYPQYYKELISSDEGYYFESTGQQWFKVSSIIDLDDEKAEGLLMQKTGKKVNDVIDTTRTAVMFVRNEFDFIF